MKLKIIQTKKYINAVNTKKRQYNIHKGHNKRQYNTLGYNKR